VEGGSSLVLERNDLAVPHRTQTPSLFLAGPVASKGRLARYGGRGLLTRPS
jgi:hypothetical protein